MRRFVLTGSVAAFAALGLFALPARALQSTSAGKKFDIPAGGGNCYVTGYLLNETADTTYFLTGIRVDSSEFFFVDGFSGLPEAIDNAGGQLELAPGAEWHNPLTVPSAAANELLFTINMTDPLFPPPLFSANFVVRGFTQDDGTERDLGVFPFQVVAAPEPGSLGYLVPGALALAGIRRRATRR